MSAREEREINFCMINSLRKWALVLNGTGISETRDNYLRWFEETSNDFFNLS